MTAELFPARPVVLVDDDEHILASFRALLASDGITNVRTFFDSREVIPCLSAQKVAVVVLDIRMPHISGDVLLGEIKEKFPDVPVIMVTASQDIDTVIECMKKRPVDYLVKPVEKNRFLSAVRNVIEMCDMRSEIELLKEYLLSNKLKNPEAFSRIITRNSGMFSIFQYIEAISSSRQPVLITGETGVGKELVARAVHDLTGSKGDFIAVNVAGLDDTMFSDTLFGHVRGAFTGADKPREGMIHAAAGGTLFLDEVGDMSETSQLKLLRLLQDNIYFPLGSDLPKRSKARVVTATNRNIAADISDGRFRKDLYYRLCAHHIQIPPLSERRDDIPLLLAFLIDEAASAMGKKVPDYPASLPILLSCYDFPGNVREMKTMVFDAVARDRSGMLSPETFREMIMNADPSGRALPAAPLPELACSFNRFPTMEEIEDYIVKEALNRSGGNKSVAASLLGITRQGLHKRLNRVNI